MIQGGVGASVLIVYEIFILVVENLKGSFPGKGSGLIHRRVGIGLGVTIAS